MKLTVSKSKNSASFYVQKSIRKSNGSTTTITIEKLGNIDKVRAKAGGKDPYVWAQEYVNELNRREYEEQKEIIVSCSPGKLLKKDEAHSYNAGYLFLQSIYYSLGLGRICKVISTKHDFEYDLNDVLSKLIYTRVLYPSSKRSSLRESKKLLEQPSFQLHDVYRALSVLTQENDFIQSELYKNSLKLVDRRRDVLYYDCTNYYFELEEADDFRKYGKGKQHQPLPLVGMGLFMDYDGIPLAFDLYPGNQSEQPTLKPLEQKILKEFGLKNIIVCTDAGLSSRANRQYNDFKLGDTQIRSFITTQSIKQLPSKLRTFCLSTDGWHLAGDEKVYDLEDLDEKQDYEKIFFKERWITEDSFGKEKKQGIKPLEQHLIVSFSLKYRNYLRKTRDGQIKRAQQMINSGKYKQRPYNQNDPHRFIGKELLTSDGEVCDKEVPFLNIDVIAAEEQYDGFYAICTNIEDLSVDQIIRINKKRWEIEECFRIMKTDFRARPVYLQTEERIRAHFLACYAALVIFRILEKKLGERYSCEEIIHTLKDMNMYRPGEKQGYLPAYTRTDLTDALHEVFGFRTDYEILSDVSMKQVIRLTKKKK